MFEDLRVILHYTYFQVLNPSLHLLNLLEIVFDQYQVNLHRYRLRTRDCPVRKPVPVLQVNRRVILTALGATHPADEVHVLIVAEHWRVYVLLPATV